MNPIREINASRSEIENRTRERPENEEIDRNSEERREVEEEIQSNEERNEETVIRNDEEDDVRPVVCATKGTNVRSRRGPGRPSFERSGSRGRPRKIYQTPNRNDEEDVASHVFLSEIPMNLAISGPEAEEWFEAMTKEVKSVLKNDTFELVDRPVDKDVIGSRIVLRNKYKADGSVDKRKARLVAQGFSQRPGVHFNQTFAPVARMSSIRLLMSLAARLRMKVHQFDVTTAYLNGTLEEEMYMQPPKQFETILRLIVRDEDKDSEVSHKAQEMLQRLERKNQICFLKKSLYGLKQAGRRWHPRLDEVLKKIGAVPTSADTCVYSAHQGKDRVLMAIYVDDIIIASKNPAKIREFYEKLAIEFEMKNLGEVGYCLGVEFSRQGNSIIMNQKGYIKDLLSRFRMTDCNPVSTPMNPQIKLTKGKPAETENVPYRELIGALTYLAITTRPDICHAVNYLSQFNNCYDGNHWSAAKRVLRYLKGTMDIGLTYSANSEEIVGYVDADWANCPDDRRSYTGFIFTLGGSPISWKSKKQSTVALSSTESEYMALTEGVKEAMYLRRFLIELVFDRDVSCIKLYSDNQGAIRLAENPTFHNRSKHIDTRHHFIREVLNSRQIVVSHIPTERMMADILTKGLPGPKHSECMKMMRLRS